MNHGGVLDYPVLPPALPCHVPPPANLRGGTGVFLPRVEAYRYAPATAKGNYARTRILPYRSMCCIASRVPPPWDGWMDRMSRYPCVSSLNTSWFLRRRLI